MNKRIKTVFTLSVITVALVLAGQAYWLYNQLVMNVEQDTERLKTATEKALQDEVEMRYAMYDFKKDAGKNALRTKISMVIKDRYDSAGRKKGYKMKRRKTSNTVTFMTGGRKGSVVMHNLDVDDAMKIATRYQASLAAPFRKNTVDSLLAKEGFGPVEGVRIYKSQECSIRPRFSESGRLWRTLHVNFSLNPINRQTLSFTVPVPLSQAVRMMVWQLVGSTLLCVVLALCMWYLLRTIIIQKRIDRLRREFIKNMMYELKPAPETEPVPTDAVRIGRTDFYYAANELRRGNERVIITSRQAEILRMLADRMNDVVSREELLNKVWGDDSYSNSNALNVQITYLRRALRGDPSVQIEAVIRKGYSLKNSLSPALPQGEGVGSYTSHIQPLPNPPQKGGS